MKHVATRFVKAMQLAMRADGRKAGQVRLAAIVVISTMLLWMGFSWLGGQLELPVRFVFLVDFAALAAFFFAMVVLFRASRLQGSQEGK